MVRILTDLDEDALKTSLQNLVEQAKRGIHRDFISPFVQESRARAENDRDTFKAYPRMSFSASSDVVSESREYRKDFHNGPRRLHQTTRRGIPPEAGSESLLRQRVSRVIAHHALGWGRNERPNGRDLSHFHRAVRSRPAEWWVLLHLGSPQERTKIITMDIGLDCSDLRRQSICIGGLQVIL